ncbi:hypothetical protein RQP46_003703 [Phenoliferia psychrophenolica]
MMQLIGHQVTSLVLYEFRPSEAIGLVRACPNLRTLGLLSIMDPTVDGELEELTESIASLQSLWSLGIVLDDSCEQGWPIEALASLKNDPPPVKRLQLAFFPFTDETLRLVDHFRSTLTALVFEPWNPEHTETLASPSSLAAYSSLVHSRGLDPTVLDQPHLTPFHPKAELAYSENELEFMGGVLDRTLEFEKLEVRRLVAEGSVKQAVAWVEKLKPVEEARLAWKD